MTKGFRVNDFSHLMRALASLRVRVEKTTRGHFKVYAPKGVVVIANSTDYRGVRNAISMLRRFGVPL